VSYELRIEALAKLWCLSIEFDEFGNVYIVLLLKYTFSGGIVFLQELM